MSSLAETVTAENDSQGANVRPFVGRTYHFIEYVISAGVKFNSLPFTYDKANLRCHVKTTSPKFILWTITMLLSVAMELGQIVRELVRANEDANTSRGEWCLVAFLFISWMFMAQVHLNVFLHPYEMVNHLNQLVRMRQWYGESKMPRSGDYKIIRTQIYFCFLQFLAQASMISAEREKNQFLYSYLPEESRSVVTTAVWTLYAFYRVATNFQAGLLQYFVGALHVETCNQVMQLRDQKGTTGGGRLKYYRMLQILCSRYTKAYGSLFIPSVTAFVVNNIILGIYGIIKLHDQLEFDKLMNFPIMISVMILGLFTFYPKVSTLYEGTKDEALNSLRVSLANASHESSADFKVRRTTVIEDDVEPESEPENAFTVGSNNWKGIRLVARSCPVLGVPFGSFYFVKRSTVLTLFDFIACNAVSTLIAYP